MSITHTTRAASVDEIAAEMDRRGNVIKHLETRLGHIDRIYIGAIDNLLHHQLQLDMDGVNIGVSRQALTEVLIGVEAAHSDFGGYDPAIEPTSKDAQIKRMVDRFLAWRLPENFNPDGGIIFSHTSGGIENKPTGTNLFDYTQATEMVRFLFGLPASPTGGR